MTDRAAGRWPWLADVGLILYVGWLAHSFAVRGPAIAGVMRDFGTELPRVTSVVLWICTPAKLYPLAGMVALILIAKNRLVPGEVARLSIGFCVLLFVLSGVAIANDALLQPLLRLFTVIGGPGMEH